MIMEKRWENNLKSDDATFFGTVSVAKILLKIAPPVMLAQLIQALYNIVDSFFIGKFSDDGLTALSVIYPVQLLITAIAVGTGVGVNTYMAKLYAQGKDKEAKQAAGVGMFLALLSWVIFSLIAVFAMRPYVMTSAKSEQAMNYAVIYGLIVCVGSIGIFLESIWTKVHQAHGNMKLPMIAQIVGAVVNIGLDPLLIFTCKLGVAGAAIATIIGQIAAAVIVGIKGFHLPPKIRQCGEHIKQIYKLGYPSILMQVLYTVYIIVLNIILAGFSDEAVTVLGLYYKIQSFFFIPLMGLQTCIVPVLSYNYTTQSYDRCKKIIWESIFIAAAFMIIGTVCFEAFPKALIGIFSQNELTKKIGSVAFRIIGASFIPAAFSLILPTFFQAIGKSVQSVILSLIRQLVCLIPVFYAFSFLGLNYTWVAFPVAEVVTGTIGLNLYFILVRKWNANKL